MTAISIALGVKSVAAGSVASVLGLIISEVTQQTKSEREYMMDDILHQMCGVKAVPTSANTTKWTVQTGLCISEMTIRNSLGAFYDQSFGCYDGGTMKGVKYYVGEWSY